MRQLILFSTIILMVHGGYCGALQDKPGVFEADVPGCRDCGASSVRISKMLAGVLFSKWNGEALLGISPLGFFGSGNLNNGKVSWDTPEQTLNVYPINPVRTFDDGGLEMEIVLKSKKSPNVFYYQIEWWWDYDFFYMPPFKNENPDGSRWEDNGRGGIKQQPENVAGSYAVYHKTKRDYVVGGTNYQTGKICQIYRPQATDADGNKVWGTIAIDDQGFMRVEIPQEFLDNATYPVVVDPTFGWTNVGGATDNPSNNQIWLKSPTTPSSNGTITSVSTYGKIRSLTPTFAPALYTDTSNLPDVKVVSVDSGGTAFGVSDDTITTSVTPTSITNGTQYWLGIMIPNGGSIDADIHFDTNGSATELVYQTFPGATTVPWPNPTGGSFSGSVPNERWTIWATFTATGGGAVAAPVRRRFFTRR